MGNEAKFIPRNWAPEPRVLEWVQERRPDLYPDIDEIIENFILYWETRGDAKAKKRNWTSCFKIWVKNQTLRKATERRFNSLGDEVPML